jgi:hypothetical protein
MDLYCWLSIHFEKGFNAIENMHRNDIRVLESRDRHLEDSGNGEMIMVSCILMTLKRCSGGTSRSCQLLNTGVMTKWQEVASREKGHLRMEELTEAINSSSQSRIFCNAVEYGQGQMVKWQRQIEKILTATT